MPTGYTAAVADGKIVKFADFAMACARAFGACITMRDDPAEAAIPDEFLPCDYNLKALREAETELVRLCGLSEDQKQMEAASTSAKRLKSWQDRETDKSTRKTRYKAMLAEASAWEPPTTEHVELRSFMIQQLRDSIKWDCTPSNQPAPMSAAEWYDAALAEAQGAIARHSGEHAKEVERARSRTKWIADLRASLASKASETEPAE